MQETNSQGYTISVSNKGYYNGPSNSFHRIYTWNGSNNTSMRLEVDYADYNKSYENLIVYIGKSNRDINNTIAPPT